MNKFKYSNPLFMLLMGIIVLGLSISLQSTVAAWSSPTITPPGGNVNNLIRTISSIPQQITGGLGIIGVLSAETLNVINNVGVGILSPRVMLDVAGEIRPGSTGASCTSQIEGSLRYNPSNKNIEYCVNNAWTGLTAVDNTPDAFSFSTDLNQQLNIAKSVVLTPTGYDSATVSVSGPGNPQVNCNGTGWSTSCTLQKTQSVQIIKMTSTSYSASETVTVTIGGSSAGWTSITMAQPAVSGACGSSNGGSFSSAPTGGFCSLGSYSGLSGSGPWSWTCYGSGGGSNASCVAYYSNPVKGTGSCTTNVYCNGTWNCGGAYEWNASVQQARWCTDTWSFSGAARNTRTGEASCILVDHPAGRWCDSWSTTGSASADGGAHCTDGGTVSDSVMSPQGIVAFICKKEPSYMCSNSSVTNQTYSSGQIVGFECR